MFVVLQNGLFVGVCSTEDRANRLAAETCTVQQCDANPPHRTVYIMARGANIVAIHGDYTALQDDVARRSHERLQYKQLSMDADGPDLTPMVAAESLVF